MDTKGFFELRGTAEELLPKLRGTPLERDGFVYFADLGDGTIRIGMTRGMKSQINTLTKTAAAAGKPIPQRFGVTPILSNQEIVKRQLHKALAPHWIEGDLFRVTESIVDETFGRVRMNVLRSCRWPNTEGYFNHYGKDAVKPKT